MSEIKAYLQDCYKNKKVKKKRAVSIVEDDSSDKEINRSTSENTIRYQT